MMESCREKIVSDKYADFLWKSSWSPNGLESFFPEVCFQMINDYYDVYYVPENIWKQDPELIMNMKYFQNYMVCWKMKVW